MTTPIEDRETDEFDLLEQEERWHNYIRQHSDIDPHDYQQMTDSRNNEKLWRLYTNKQEK